MSFLKKLFGGAASSAAAGPSKSLEHKGFIVEARPFPAGGQFQLAGVIWREFDGVRKEQSFIRADQFASRDEAASFALKKGCQIIDEQGDSLFR